MDHDKSPYEEGSLHTEGWNSFYKDCYQDCPYLMGSEEYRLWGEGWTHAYECSH